MSDRPQEVSPELIFGALTAYQASAALAAAIELDVFTAVAEGNVRVADIARRCEATERGVRILCDSMVMAGFLAKDADGYALPAASATFLDRRSPAYLGGAVEFLHSPMVLDSFRDLAGVVRTGRLSESPEGTVAPDHPVWVKFARAMGPMMAMSAELIGQLLDVPTAGRLRVLDVAAGHGMFGIALARQNPEVEVVALDWQNVLEVARANAVAAGVADRYATLPGSAFDADFGGEYDLVLLTNFLHHFDAQTCESLLRKVRASLAPGGRAAAYEFVPNDDRVSPPASAGFALTMLGTTPAGDAYTFREFERMFANAGFSRSELHELPPTLERVVVGYR